MIADIRESINAPMVNTIANEMAKLRKEDSIKNTLTKGKTIMPTIAKNIMPLRKLKSFLVLAYI
jgi:hypothetical protein